MNRALVVVAIIAAVLNAIIFVVEIADAFSDKPPVEVTHYQMAHMRFVMFLGYGFMAIYYSNSKDERGGGK